jgi:hypothetical protein
MDMPLPRRNFLFGIAALPATSLLARRPLPGLTTTVYNGYELHTALQAAGPGSRLLLAPGSYGDIGQFVLASSNISVRVQAPSRTILRAPLVVTGDQVDLDGLALMEDVHLAGLGLVIGNSLFVGSGLKLTGVDSEVHHCDFGQYKSKAVDVRATATGAYIHDNVMHDPVSSGANAVMVGVSTMDTGKIVGARIENNQVRDAIKGSSETIIFKSSGNICSGNTLVNCNNISNRHGEDNQIIANRLEWCKGIVVQDARTLLADNVLLSVREGPGIQIMAGTAPWNAQVQGDHPQAVDTVLRNNTGPLMIGRKYSGYNYPALNTQVESHVGKITLKFQQGTIVQPPPPVLPPGSKKTKRA